MTDTSIEVGGGCLCGALRYVAEGPPLFAGFCCCTDCRRASGSGSIPYMGFAGTVVRISGETRQFRSPSFRGGETIRNFCARCGALVFGGEQGKSDFYTIYAGTLDDPSLFSPTEVIFARDRPEWVTFPSHLKVHETLPD